MLIEGGFQGWWRKYSAAALAAIVAIQAAWKMSDDLHVLLNKEWLDTATLIIAIAGFIGRFLKQTQKGDPP